MRVLVAAFAHQMIGMARERAGSFTYIRAVGCRLASPCARSSCVDDLSSWLLVSGGASYLSSPGWCINDTRLRCLA